MPLILARVAVLNVLELSRRFQMIGSDTAPVQTLMPYKPAGRGVARVMDDQTPGDRSDPHAVSNSVRERSCLFSVFSTDAEHAVALGVEVRRPVPAALADDDFLTEKDFFEWAHG